MILDDFQKHVGIASRGRIGSDWQRIPDLAEKLERTVLSLRAHLRDGEFKATPAVRNDLAEGLIWLCDISERLGVSLMAATLKELEQHD